jgi:hypothetical protein
MPLRPPSWGLEEAVVAVTGAAAGPGRVCADAVARVVADFGSISPLVNNAAGIRAEDGRNSLGGGG